MTGAVRLGLIGAGRWGRAYINTVPQASGAALSRVASRNPETAGILPPGCKLDIDWRDMIRANDVDGVIIAAPPGVHAEMALRALASGKAVMIEKPLTLDVAQARQLLSEAERVKRPVIVDHTMLFHPAYGELKRRAQGLGPIRKVTSAGCNWGPFRPDTNPLWDYGPHDIALCLDLLGHPLSLECRTVESRPLPEGFGANYQVVLRYPFGVVAELFFGNMSREKRRYFEVDFGGTSLIFDDLAGAKLSLRQADHSPRPIAIDPAKPLTCAVEVFVDQIRQALFSPSSLRLGVSVVETIALAECKAVL